MTPPPGVVGDVVCRFYNSTSGSEAVTNTFAPPDLTCSTGDKFTFGVWALASQNVGMEFFVNPAGSGSATVGWQVTGDGNWRFYQNTVTTASGATNATAFFRVDNNSAGSAVYLTGATIRKNPTSGVILPYTPRYSPISGKGTVLATRNLIAKEAAIKTLTGNVGIGTMDPKGPLHVNYDKAIINQQMSFQTFNVYKTAGGLSGTQTRRYYRVYVPNSYANFQIIFRGFARNYIGNGDVQAWRRQYTVQRNAGASFNVTPNTGEDINANGFTFAHSSAGSYNGSMEVHFDVTFPPKPEYSTYITFTAQVIGDTGYFAENTSI